jgi:DNA-binding NtrC family response regulator
VVEYGGVLPNDPLVLIVDDDPAVIASLALLLKRAGYRAESAATAEDGLARVRGGGHALVLLDMNFSRATSGAEGLELLRGLKAARPELPVVLMTAWGSISLAVEGMKGGAADFVTKPWTNEQLLGVVKTALELAAAPAPGEKALTREKLDALYDVSELAGEDPRFLRVLELVGRVASTDAPVLITGESGTGKELVAAALHANGPRKAGPFVKVNLGGISATLFESEMFGHVRGAFTDAQRDRTGRFELADRGTIFLDEIGELATASQVKLLRVLQDRTYEVLGSSVTRSADVRVVSATNRELAALVRTGDFREDLLYRLNLIAVELPPLRERAGDVALLARRFVKEIGARYRRELALSPGALKFLSGLSWPGNVRQLRHVLERTALVAGKDLLEAADFMAAFDAESRERKEALPEVGAMTLEEMEKAMIVKGLKHHAGNLSRVADALGLSRAALYRRLEKYGIDVG